MNANCCCIQYLLRSYKNEGLSVTMMKGLAFVLEVLKFAFWLAYYKQHILGNVLANASN
jgi:hypothetical protein